MVGGILVNYLFFQESKIHWLVCVSFKRAGSFTSMLLSEHLVLLSVSEFLKFFVNKKKALNQKRTIFLYAKIQRINLIEFIVTFIWNTFKPHKRHPDNAGPKMKSLWGKGIRCLHFENRKICIYLHP